ncbi:acyl protein synthetase LuxE [Candidatus Photodesmus katoptron]|uniref:Acyl protein synthetase LuxE n=1 Tax=Candidatus Photodesmus katoptron Akat1 TaxID=1236703 RepID=S3EH17_9GAMM|nr:acyl protein synthetase LuxE [Candidatus Photodesmus katoptron]EPE37468.1 acyl protein synthetase LuxE [Candidatus Photodesmus katoptron Akat1]KEY90297.1 acyl protein synthetase LuxE [Candidatus Photodesmus katoptron]
MSITSHIHVKVENINVSSEIDNLIFMSSPLDFSYKAQKEIQKKLILQTFHHHYIHNIAYRNYCQVLGVDDSISNINDIPVFPTSIFKHRKILTSDKSEIENWFTSSGTQGIKSLVPRDRVSIERLLGSVSYGMKYVGNWLETEMELVNLGPDRFHVSNIWFQYVMSLVELLYPTTFTVQNEKIDFELTLKTLNKIQSSNKTICLVGPPYFVFLLCEYMEKNKIIFNGSDQLYIITGGGWKNHNDKSLNRLMFNQLLIDKFQLANQSQIRDTFNQVELNTCFFEDQQQRKRVPPWVYARALDPESLKPVINGKKGILSFMDASATSYPAFLITDDIGIISEHTTDGLLGTSIEVIGRMKKTSAQRGCALSMSRAFANNA